MQTIDQITTRAEHRLYLDRRLRAGQSLPKYGRDNPCTIYTDLSLCHRTRSEDRRFPTYAAQSRRRRFRKDHQFRKGERIIGAISAATFERRRRHVLARAIRNEQHAQAQRAWEERERQRKSLQKAEEADSEEPRRQPNRIVTARDYVES